MQSLLMPTLLSSNGTNGNGSNGKFNLYQPRKFQGGICCGGHLNLWRRDIVPPDFFVAKPAKQA